MHIPSLGEIMPKIVILLVFLCSCLPNKEKISSNTRQQDELKNAHANLDLIIETQFMNEKTCQSVFTGNKGNYASAKPSYGKVVAYSLLQDLCGIDSPGSVLDLFQQPSLGNKDALSLSQFNYGSSKVKSTDNLMATYALMYSLGQRESNGNFNEGRDLTASNTGALTEEAGLFQISANSLNLKSKKDQYRLFLRKLFQDYLKTLSRMNESHQAKFCLLNVLGEDHESKSYDTSGKRLNTLLEKGSCSRIKSSLKDINFTLDDEMAACFRDLTKTCPSFALKYGGGVARIRRDHNGPLILHEEFGEAVDPKYLKPYLEPACHNLFKAIIKDRKKLCKSEAVILK